ncbi:PhnD/SsuA/transferrin family substrate-binding protein [Hyalangium sp.]|uniref:PhnD/SsuA/transferrin family substrate-binding protein n=1 Tax=Hyalangium sp. TaxID=2028555 RepID=UPI002D4C5715|nr:PhnD/SsuA/transferrin family substrate-binding protein [Hyalangium sp.]HYI01738.1 PhnD/SsuA/transferrin family substrate-binding protein [Hyalangium sp.]
MSPPIRFLLYPTNGVVREHVRADLFGRVLSQRLGRPVIVEVARTYEEVVQELAAGRVDMAWATAEQCDQFEPQARAVLRAVRAGRWHYHAALVCRADAPLTLERLRGTRAAWVAPLSTGGYLLPRRYLETQGLSPSELFSEQRFYGSYRKALLVVLSGEADFTAQYTTHPDEHTIRAHMADRIGADECRLKCFAVSGPTLSDGIILTSRLAEEDAAVLISVLTGMLHDGSGMEPLLGLFNIEGFALVQGTGQVQSQPLPTSHSVEHVVVELDARGCCQHLWSSTGRAFGQAVHEAGGRTLREVLPTEAAERLETLARAVQISGVGGRHEYLMELEGKTHLYAVQAMPRPASSGEVSRGISLLVRDITESSSLDGEVYRLASFPLLHPDPMMELELGGTLRYANPTAHAAFPDLLAQGPGHPLVETALASIQRAVPNEAPPVVHLAGRYWELAITAMQDNENLRVFAKDVTARKQVESSLMHADRMASLGSLAARVGHQMNNPLAWLMANLSFAREEVARLQEHLTTGKGDMARSEIDEILNALGEALEGAEGLKTIVQDLHVLTREPARYRARVSVHAVLENTLKLIRGELRHRARLEKDFQPVPPVETDEARLGQVFLNLVLHAVQAMSEQGEARNVLRVATRTGSAGEVVIEIQDTGAGMTAEVLARLFEPSFTALPSSVGMGLSVSHAIVLSLGGSLSAESQAGVGTRFTVTLPLAGSPDVSRPPRE